MGIIGIISPIIGVVVGFFLGFILEWWKKRNLIIGYSTILQSELRNLKEDEIGGLDDVIEKYNSNFIGGGKPVPTVPEITRANEFLGKWSFWHKYAFLRNNLDKLYLLNPDTVKSILKIYSWMEEFEQFRTRSPPLLLIQNLQYAKNEIPLTLSLLEKEGAII